MINDERRATGPEDTWGRLSNPAWLAEPRRPALRTSHFFRAPPTRDVGQPQGDVSGSHPGDDPAERDLVVKATWEAAHKRGLNPRTRRKRLVTADFVAFLAGTGVRIDEARRLRWDQVDLEQARAHIQRTKSESSSRWLSLPTGLVTRLATRRERDGGTGVRLRLPHSSKRPRATMSSATAPRPYAPRWMPLASPGRAPYVSAVTQGRPERPRLDIGLAVAHPAGKLYVPRTPALRRLARTSVRMLGDGTGFEETLLFGMSSD